jgi:TatA/E family protein of Tat protein translocase
MGIENPVHLLFIAIIALVVLGPKRLPELARALGNGIREFRESVGGHGEPTIEQALRAEPPAAHPDPAAPPAPAPASSPAAPAASAAVAPAPSAAAPTVDPAQSIRSGDAPDRRPL